MERSVGGNVYVGWYLTRLVAMVSNPELDIQTLRQHDSGLFGGVQAMVKEALALGGDAGVASQVGARCRAEPIKVDSAMVPRRGSPGKQVVCFSCGQPGHIRPIVLLGKVTGDLASFFPFFGFSR